LTPESSGLKSTVQDGTISEFGNVRAAARKVRLMNDHVYKHIDLTGSSTVSSDDAIRRAISKAAETVRGMHWFEVVETRGYIDDASIAHWQVTIRVGFRIEG
jgi:dodecin